MKFRTIVADPPWAYPNPGQFTYARDGANATHVTSAVKYGAMTLDEIKAVRPPAEDDAHLYLWTTNSFVVEAHQIADAWGFRPITLLTWVKTRQDDPSRVSFRTGYYFRGATEHCLFGVRGSLRLQTAEPLPTAYLWPRLPHSVKPDAFYDLVEQASPGPYLELFARRARLGWEYAGNESLSTVHIEGLAK